MAERMPPALSEAVGALRVLGDPTSAFGVKRDEGMAAFARAARERVVQLHRGQTMCATCGEEPAGHSGRCSRCDRNILEERDAA